MMIGPDEHDAYYAREQLADHISRVSLAAVGCVEPFGPNTSNPSVDSPISPSYGGRDSKSTGAVSKSADR
jgi:hypothetical protein